MRHCWLQQRASWKLNQLNQLNQLKDNAGSSDAPEDASGLPGACVEEQQPPATKEQQPPATEVLVCRPKREQQMLDFLQPAMISSSGQHLRREQGRRCKVSFQFCAFVLLSLFVKHAVDILVIHGVWCATFWSKKWHSKPRDGSNFPLRGLIRRVFSLQREGARRKKALILRFHCGSCFRCTYWEHDWIAPLGAADFMPLINTCASPPPRARRTSG